MSEALTKPLPPDFPLDIDARPRINMRKAMAGVYLLSGDGSLLKCLVKAGFSRATARCQLRNGLTVDQCVAEASKLDPLYDPAKLLETGRRRMGEALHVLDPLKTPLRDVTRAFEATEKWFGGHELPTNSKLVTVADRLSQVAALLAVAQRRGLPVPRVEQPFVEAEVVATAGENSVIREHGTVNAAAATSKDTASMTASAKKDFVNPNW